MFTTNFYYRLKYQLKKKAPMQVFLYFFLDRIKHPFIKSKKKIHKNAHQNYLKSKITSTDYFSINAYYWYKIISKNFNEFSYLEIGSWEGNSALYILKNYNTNKVLCVDLWEKDNKFKEINSRNFQNFKTNMIEFKNRFSFYKQSSDNFFLENQQKFDVIYVDGWHEAPQVLKDINNAWNFLNKNGILICDDYFYGDLYGESNNVPAIAINQFLNKKKSKFKILCVNNSQIFIKKI